MTALVANYAVGDVDTWLKGGDFRKRALTQFCSSYRVFRHPESNRVTLVFEDADADKLRAFTNSPESKAAQTKNTVIEPIDFCPEIEGAG